MKPVCLALAFCIWSMAASITAADPPCRTGKGAVAADATCRSVALIQSKTSSEQTSGNWMEEKEEHMVGAERWSAHALPLTLPEMDVFVRDQAASLAAGQVAPEEVSAMVSLMRDFLQNMLNETYADHSSDQEALDSSLKLLAACSPNVSALGAAAQEERAAHTACRALEADNADTELTACEEYHSKRKGEFANPPTCDFSKINSDDADELEELETCMKLFSKWFQVHEYGQACRDAEKKHKSQTSQCVDAQGDFESSVCSQADGQQDFCNCHELHLAFYEKSTSDIETREANRKVDFRTAQRIECLLGVMEQHNASKAVVASRASGLEDCTERKFSADFLNISYGEDKVPVLGTKCETIGKPCEATWLSTEYESQSWNAKAPAVACTPCKTTTTMTLNPCQWDVNEGHHLNGGGENKYRCRTESTLQGAKHFCFTEPTCIGFDWRPGMSGTSSAQCWYFGGSAELGAGSGMNAYKLPDRDCTEDAPVAPKCHWTLNEGYHLNGGGEGKYRCREETTLQGAKQFCLTESTCIGFDWRPASVGTSSAQCWYYGGTAQLGAGSGINSYKLPGRPCTITPDPSTEQTSAVSSYQAGVPIADRFPEPPSGRPEWPRVVGQGSWYGMTKEKVSGGGCNGAYSFPAYNMLYGCSAGCVGSSWVGPDCQREQTCPDILWFTMDLGSVKNVKSVSLKPETPCDTYKSNHYELLISTDEPGPRGPYASKPYPSFAVTSSGFQRVVDSGNIGSATNKEYTHAINQRARFIMFHALAWNNDRDYYRAAGVEYLRVDAE